MSFAIDVLSFLEASPEPNMLAGGIEGSLPPSYHEIFFGFGTRAPRACRLGSRSDPCLWQQPRTAREADMWFKPVSVRNDSSCRWFFK